MPAIQDVPVEIWLNILEYLDISELHAFNKVYKETLSWVIAQVARKLVKKFLISAELRLDSFLICPEFQFPGPDADTAVPRLDGPQLCPLVFRGCHSRMFRKNELASTEMIFQFACTRCKHWDLRFHPCLYGTEPAEIVSLFADFHSNEKLADGS